MPFLSRSDHRIVLVGTACLIAVLACNDTPAAPVASMSSTGVQVARAEGDKPEKGKGLQFARVTSDGTLVDGTALSAEWLGTGSYRVRFDPPIDGCAGVAGSAAFAGFDHSAFRVIFQVSVGFGDGGAPDDGAVTLRSTSTLDGSDENTSFNLILVCP